VLCSENGPQYVSREMSEFATVYGFTKVISSPHYSPLSNKQRTGLEDSKDC